MASMSSQPATISQHEIDTSTPFPKPPTPNPPTSTMQNGTSFDALLPNPPTDPPPPYPATRSGRRARGNQTRSMRRASQPSDDSQVGAPDSGGESESSPLLGTRRRRNSHSSTIQSVQSLAHTVFTLFEAEAEVNPSFTDIDERAPSMLQSTPVPRFWHRAKRYFRPLTRRAYYYALFHLMVINFPYELGAWIFLFVGTLTGTTLLITLPLGAIICFLDLLGARALARGEIALQTYFHGPLSITQSHPKPPIFSRLRSPSPDPSLEPGRHHRAPVLETSFLRLAYLMFRDPTSYQALFYFLVIKPGLTLLITITLIVLVPPAFVLVLPAPAVLRAVRRVGIWQAEVAIDALGCTQPTTASHF